jgi:hypothetical protein
MRIRYLAILVVLFLVCTAPAFAATRYLPGEPSFSAALSGPNEFSPGSDAVLTVIVTNSGLFSGKVIDAKSMAEWDDAPTTAKLVTASLSPGDAPVIIRSDAQMIGDIAGGGSVPVTFSTRIRADAPAGMYGLPLNISYTYLSGVEQVGVDTLINRYKTENLTILLPVRIKPEMSIVARSVVPSELNAGTEGYLTVEIENTGDATGEAAIAEIVRSGGSPVIPVDGSVYIGTFAPGSVASGRFKVKATDDAEGLSYPLDLVVRYRNDQGDTVSTDPITIGVPVGGKIDFTIASAAETIHPGEQKLITVVFENTGATTARSAQARLITTDPFSSTAYSATLGDMLPGDRVTARFDLGISKTATIKDYALDTEVRYRDGLGNTRVSDTLKLPVHLVPWSGTDLITTNPIIISIIIAVFVIAGYYVYHRRTSRK